MDIRFDNKIAVVTGGASGIGEATSVKFAERGAAVAIFDFDEEAGRKIVQTLTSAGKTARYYKCNVASSSQVKEAIAAVVRDLGGIDVLVSNAGIQRYGDAVKTSEALWDEVMSVNLNGAFHLAQHALPEITKRGGGSLVAVCSVQSFAVVPGAAAYVVAKHGLLGLVRSIALDYARFHIRANCVCPGTVDTPLLHRVLETRPEPQKLLEQAGAPACSRTNCTPRRNRQRHRLPGLRLGILHHRGLLNGGWRPALARGWHALRERPRKPEVRRKDSTAPKGARFRGTAVAYRNGTQYANMQLGSHS